MGKGEEQDYFCDGLTEDIITALSKVPRLFVIARNSVFTYKDKPVKVQQVAEDLGVRYVLEGSVRRSEDRVRITTQLVNATSGRHLWAEKYDRELEDIFALQDEITERVLTSLKVQLTEGEQARVWDKGTDNPKARELNMKGLAHFRLMTKDDNHEARRLWEEAITLDPDYALAYLSLSWTYLQDVAFGWTNSSSDSMAKAEELAQKALALDESSPDVHALLGNIYVRKREYEKAISEGERAVALNPRSADVNALFGMTLRYAGKYQEAIEVLKRAIRLNPIPPNWYILQIGYSYFMLGDYEKSLASFKKTLDRNPRFYPSLVGVVAAYSKLGRQDEAREAAETLLKVNPKYNLEQAAKWNLYKNEADLDRYIDGLRKAGLPETSPLPLPDKPSVAVLPFNNMSGDPKQEYLSDGITESIIMAVSKIRNLFVIARTSSFKYKGKEVDVRTVGRELGVQYVLEGSVQRSGNRLRITAQLIDALQGDHVWSERYDRELKDLFAMQDEITMSIMEAMRVKLIEGEQVLKAKHPRNIESALKTYEAEALSNQFNKESMAMAKNLAEEVIAEEPEYGEAYYILSTIHMLYMWYGWGKSPQDSLQKSLANAEKAVSLDESLSRAWGIRGYLHAFIREYIKSVDYAEKGVAVDPNGADAHAWLGNCLHFAERDQEAISHFEKAMRLNPFPPPWYYFTSSSAYRVLGRYEEAIAVLKKSLSIAPNSLSSYLHLTYTYWLMGRMDDARAAAAEILKINPGYSAKSVIQNLPHKNQSYVEKWAEAMRDVGLLRD
jgi:TolB-like protein/Tfp pilus assembly protein PilF